MLYAGVAELSGDGGGGVAGFEEHPLGRFETLQLEVLIEGTAGLEPQQVVEIGDGEPQPGGTICGRGQEGITQPAGTDVVVEERVKLFEDGFIAVLAGDELPFVEAGAVVQHQLDVA